MVNLKKLKFKEQSLPKRSLNLYFLGFFLLFAGTVANHVVIKNNHGDMPVWTAGDSSFSKAAFKSTEHFEIKLANKVENLPLADIYRIRNRIYSIGDILMIFGSLLIGLGGLIHAYNDTLNFLIRRKMKGGYKK